MAKSYDADVVAKIAQEVMSYKQAYYAGKPLVSDAKYDALEDQLRQKAPHHPALDFVGSDPDAKSSKVTHQTSMLSLAKTYKEEELESWAKDRKLVGMLKVDGNSLSVIYEKGVMTLAKTRGNGRQGENVSEKAAWVADIIPKLGLELDLEIRGELYCTESSFYKLSEEMVALGLERPTNPRNIVAGLLGRKNHYNLARYFNFFAFDVLLNRGEAPYKTEEKKVAWLKKQGFRLPLPRVLNNKTDMQKYLQEVRLLMDEGEVGLDGAVFTYDDLALHAELGNTSHHPRYKMSFKWQGETAISTIQSITWATSRLGIVTPVAVIEPVNLSGANITNVTLHNAAHVKNFQLKPGDEIEIVRSGEVIPKFLSVIKEGAGIFQLPSKCPECQSTLEFDDVRLLCLNEGGCPAQQSGMILNWIKCVEIDDLSEKRLSQMIEVGLVSEVADLYKLSVDDFLTLPQTKEKLATKLHTNIQQSKNIELARFLSGLGILGAGLTSWEKIIENHPSLESIMKLSADELAALDGFAEKSATQICEGLKKRSVQIKKLLSAGVQPYAEVIGASGEELALAGKQVAITGSLSLPRAKIQEMIKKAGGKPASAVSKNTFAVVTGDPESTSSKMVKARELGVEIWSEQHLIDLLDS